MKDIWQVWPSALSAQECDEIINRAQTYPVGQGTVGAEQHNRIDHALRDSSVRWMKTENERKIIDRLMGFVNSSNRTNFGFDIVEPYELQFTEYHGTNNGYYGWHHDVHLTHSKPYERKLTAVVQLSDRESYEGGGFEFQTAPKPSELFEKRGSILIFPSFLVHRVLPVTRGVRYSLVTWVEGPQWR
jgi:PKHD-type hydroxylase